MRRQTFKHATQVSKYIATQEDRLNHQITKFNELLQLFSKEGTARRRVDLLKMLKQQTQVDKPSKNVCKMNHNDRYEFDPQVGLHIEGVLVP